MNQLELTISGVSGTNKSYDGGTSDTITGTASLTGVVLGDTVTLGTSGASASFGDKNASTGKAVTFSGYTISGTDAANYSLTQPTSTADITTVGLTITGVSGTNKVYDGGTSDTITGTASLSGVISGDTVNLGTSGASASFLTKDVGTGKTVTFSGYTITGTDAGNYSLTQPGSSTADITPLGITVTDITANNKVYDDTTSATLSTGSATLVGVISPDTVTLVTTSVSASFATSWIGTNITVTVTGLGLSGAQANDYTLTQPTGLAANITANENLIVDGPNSGQQQIGEYAVSLQTGNLHAEVSAAQDYSPLEQDVLYYYAGLEYNSDTANPQPLLSAQRGYRCYAWGSFRHQSNADLGWDCEITGDLQHSKRKHGGRFLLSYLASCESRHGYEGVQVHHRCDD